MIVTVLDTQRVFVTLSGNLNVHHSAKLSHTLNTLRQQDYQYIFVDGHEVEEIDPASLNAIIQTHKQITQEGKTLSLITPSPTLQKMLQDTLMTRIIPQYPNLERAMEGIPS